MIDWRPHRLWLALLASALIIGVTHAPLIGILQKKQQTQLTILHNDYLATDASLRQLREDIATTEKLRTEIGAAEAEKSLAPVDRLRAAQILERRAGESRLSHFSYNLSPEHPTPIDTVGTGPQALATSILTLSADAPTDIDSFIFIDAVRHALPGRLALRHFTLERIGGEDTPLSATNIRASASGDWLSNGAASHLAEIER